MPRYRPGQVARTAVDELDARLERRRPANLRRRLDELHQRRAQSQRGQVFVNWFLSRRGQIALQKHQDLYGEDAPNSRRTDIPKDVLVPVELRMQAGKRYFDVSDPKYADMTPMFDLLKQIVKVKEGK